MLLLVTIILLTFSTHQSTSSLNANSVGGKRKIWKFTVGKAGFKAYHCAQAAHVSNDWLNRACEEPYPGHLGGKLMHGLATVLSHAKDDDLVVFHDGHDATIWCTDDELLAVYSEYAEPDILISGEANCYPSDGVALADEHSRFRFPNLGAYIANCDAMWKFIEFAVANRKISDCDQALFHAWLKTSPDVIIKVDDRQRLVSNLQLAEECYSRGRINQCTKETTCGIHTNGMGSKRFVSKMQMAGMC